MFNREKLNAKWLAKVKPFKDIVDELTEMPQFITVVDGSLNLITGSVVSYDENGLILTWCNPPSGIAGGGFIQSNIKLEASLKFLELMRVQAKQFC